LPESVQRKPRVAIIGTRGYPSFYGGFETAVRHLAPALADAGWEVTVYGRGRADGEGGAGDPRIVRRTTGGVETKALSTLSYGLTATLDAVRRRTDVALVMNVANGYWLPLLKLRGIPIAMNVDGIEWERAKWGRAAKLVFRLGARLSAMFADILIVDARAIGGFWKSRYRRDSTFIPYGAVEGDGAALLTGLRHGEYVLLVARFVPENTVQEFFDAVELMALDHDIVIVGSEGYGGPLDERARNLDERYERVRWLGHLADDQVLHALWSGAGAYFHGHSVGGTNPALVQAMMLGAPIVARDTVYNREVLGEDYDLFVQPDAASIADVLERVLGDEELRRQVSAQSQGRARQHYTWHRVTESYEKALRLLLRARK
jgi:glycosyltransferase involved in cell wall biosynthesis